MKHAVSMKWTLARLYEQDLVIVDCRFALGNPDAGREAYERERVPGAVYLDLERDLSAPVDVHGGRHPLPDVESLAATFGRVGIGEGVRVVAYDDQNGAMASRLWWLLQYLGHDQVYVMEQGYSHWKAAGYPVSSTAPHRVVPNRFIPRVRRDMVADMEQVRLHSENASAVLIDAREPRRYLGLEEPLDKAAGHIPGAVNYDWKSNFREDGSWKSVDELRARFGQIAPDREIIVYCGSGVTACPNVLALREAGYANVKLYAGSWSDWISYEGNPIATGEK